MSFYGLMHWNNFGSSLEVAGNVAFLKMLEIRWKIAVVERVCNCRYRHTTFLIKLTVSQTCTPHSSNILKAAF